MYSDVKLKIQKYKERIIKEYVDKGTYPSLEMIDNDLKEIDPFLPLYKQMRVKPGEYLKSKDFNNFQVDIYEDLCILYKIVYMISMNEFMKLEEYVNSQIDQLGIEVENCNKEVNSKSTSSSLGKTILEINKDFKAKNNINKIEIDMGDVMITPNSYVSLLIDGVNLSNGDIIAKIGDHNLRPYYREKSKLYVEGEVSMKKHEFKFEENERLNPPYIIPIDISTEEKEKHYTIFSGLNNVLCKTDSSTNLMPIDQLEFHEKTTIEFYLIGAESLYIEMNNRPLDSSINIDDGIVNITERIQKISITVKPKTIINLRVDSGEIVSSKTEGILIKENLYSDLVYHNNEFIIEEIKRPDPVKFKCSLDIYKNSPLPIDIKSIVLKEKYSPEVKKYD